MREEHVPEAGRWYRCRWVLVWEHSLCKKGPLSAAFFAADVELAFTFEHWMEKLQEKKIFYTFILKYHDLSIRYRNLCVQKQSWKDTIFSVRVKIIQNNIVHVFNSYSFTGPESHSHWEVSVIVLPVKSHMNWLLFLCYLTFFISDMEEKIIPSLNDY